MGIKEEKFTCKRDELTIRGFVFHGKGENLPIAIVSHGFMANYSSTIEYAKKLATWGYAAICFDFCGGGLNSKSDGKTTAMSVFSEKADLLAVIEGAKTLKYVNPDKLVLMGCSQGGFVSALVAAELLEAVTCLVLFYPALCIPDDAKSGHMLIADFDPNNVPNIIKCGPMKLGKVYAQSVMDMNAYEAIKAYEGPVFIAHGTADNIVDPSYSQKADEVYQDSKLVLIEDGGHGFKKKQDKIALEALEAFLKERA